MWGPRSYFRIPSQATVALRIAPRDPRMAATRICDGLWGPTPGLGQMLDWQGRVLSAGRVKHREHGVVVRPASPEALIASKKSPDPYLTKTPRSDASSLPTLRRRISEAPCVSGVVALALALAKSLAVARLAPSHMGCMPPLPCGNCVAPVKGGMSAR